MILFERRHDLGILKSVGRGSRRPLRFLPPGRLRHGAGGDRRGDRRRAARRRQHQRGDRGARVDGQPGPGPRLAAPVHFRAVRTPVWRLHPLQQRLLPEIHPGADHAERDRRRGRCLAAPFRPRRLPSRPRARRAPGRWRSSERCSCPVSGVPSRRQGKYMP